MWKPIAGALALVGLIATGPLVGQQERGETSRLAVHGGSTLRSWTCATEDIRASVRSLSDEGVEVAGLPGGDHRVTVGIPVGSLDCRNGTMNRHMRRALGAERQPVIRFEMTHYRVTGPGRVTALGDLTVNGTPSPITLEVEVAPTATGIRATGSVRLDMTELGVEPPSLMLGTLKVHDPVTIEFDVYLAHDIVAVR